jgi:uncharacterized membrane protein (DUF373 family)
MVHQDFLVPVLKKFVSWVVIVLAVLITAVIVWSALDVAILLYQQLTAEPFLRLGGPDHLLTVFESFLTVLIAIEIFLNIILYLTKHIFYVKLVIATALTAVARKVIVLEYSVATVPVVYAIAAVTLAMGVAYWLAAQRESVN